MVSSSAVSGTAMPLCEVSGTQCDMTKHARAQLAIRIVQPGLHRKVAGISIKRRRNGRNCAGKACIRLLAAQ